MDIYAENILEHYKEPHNKREMNDCDVKQAAANPLCGDHLVLFLKTEDNKIADVSFDGRGCAISQAAASMLTDELAGMTIEEAGKVTKEDMLEMLGVEIGPTRLKCALLVLDALQEALAKLS